MRNVATGAEAGADRSFCSTQRETSVIARRLSPTSPITAIAYEPGAQIDALLGGLVDTLKSNGARIAGFVQINIERTAHTRCDMMLEELSSGARIAISESRGPHARGCRLDMAELARATALATAALDSQPDLLVINKFGKTEAAGRGFRCVMATAIERGIPVLTAVPVVNVDAWQAFAGDYAVMLAMDDLPKDAAVLCKVLGFCQRSSTKSADSMEIGCQAQPQPQVEAIGT